MRVAICTHSDVRAVAEAIRCGAKLSSPVRDTCPACHDRWDATHMLVYIEKLTPLCIVDEKEQEEKQRRQISIVLLEMVEDNFLKAHGWAKEKDDYYPPDNYRFRKYPHGKYSRSHAVNSQKQVYNPLYAHEKQWEGEAACGRGNRP